MSRPRLTFPHDDVRFETSGSPVPQKLVDEFRQFVDQVAQQAELPQAVYEVAKGAFGNSVQSSSLSFAESDLDLAVRGLMNNRAVFVEAVWSTFEQLREDGLVVPSLKAINDLFMRCAVGFVVEPPFLRDAGGYASPGKDGGRSATPHYVLGALIGSGAYGEVYEATRQTPFGAFKFALKIHAPSVLVGVNEPTARRRFEREVKALQKLQHRGIVQYLDAGIWGDGRYYLAMPLIEGKKLVEACPGGQPLRAVRYMREVAFALGYAHNSQVLHRDLKPNNILVRASDDQPMILDFGLAFLLDDAQSAGLSSRATGSMGYIPPEVIADHTIRSPQHDVFSCGVILYELIAGHRPNPNKYVPLARVSAECESVDSVVKQAISVNTQARTHSAEALFTRLLKLENELRAGQTTP